MKNENSYIFLAHGLTRAILRSQPIGESYLNIFKTIFPVAILDPYDSSLNIDQQYLQMVCDTIYEFDAFEVGGASCYSACIVAQALAFLHGISSEMVIGICKQDEKIVGHAWIELVGNQHKRTIINPGRLNLREFREFSRLNPERVVAEWASSL